MSLNLILKSTILRKQLVAITGVSLSLFILIHMLGNLLLFVGAKEYNEYAHKLVTNPLIFLAEVGLLGLFILHLFLALQLSFQNRKAKGTLYAVSAKGEKGGTLASKTLWHQGVVILVFVILHLITFKYGKVVYQDYGQGPIRDLHVLVVEIFQIPLYTFGYVLSLIILGFHLSHGLSSALQTLGINHPRYTPCFKGVGQFFAFLIALGFISQPLYVFFFYK